MRAQPAAVAAKNDRDQRLGPALVAGAVLGITGYFHGENAVDAFGSAGPRHDDQFTGLLFLALSGIAFLWWLGTAYAFAHGSGTVRPRYASDRAVACCLIPGAQVYFPYVAVRGLARAALGGELPRRDARLLRAWWGLWLAMWAAMWVSLAVTDRADRLQHGIDAQVRAADAAFHLLGAAAAFAAVLVVARTTRALRRHAAPPTGDAAADLKLRIRREIGPAIGGTFALTAVSAAATLTAVAVASLVSYKTPPLPVPPPRVHTAADRVAGTWTWDDTDRGTLVLSADGRYSIDEGMTGKMCLGDAPFATTGTWRIEGSHVVLTGQLRHPEAVLDRFDTRGTGDHPVLAYSCRVTTGNAVLLLRRT